MKKLAWSLAPIVVLVLASSAPAGVLLVSGDANITNPLVGRLTAVDPGNQQFFTNVLGGGDTVLVEDTTVAFLDEQAEDLDTFYNGQAGVTSSILAGPITAGALAGVDLFISILPTDDYTGSEIAALDAFLDAGGSVVFLGENSNFPDGNARINAALAALGSGLSIVNDLFDSGFNTATGAQIATDPLTTGVSTFTYAAPSRVAGGTTLFFGSGGQPFVAYEGAIQVVPEPSTLALAALGGLGLAGAIRRRRRA